MINRVLNEEYTRNKCPEYQYKDKCTKTHYYHELYEHISPTFIDEKIILKSAQGKKLYKLRPIFSKGNFTNINSHQEFII